MKSHGLPYPYMNNNNTGTANIAATCGADLSQVRNIVFDLGGVVIDLRRDAAVEALQALGMKNADSVLGLYRQEEPFLGIETGRLHAGEFFELVRLSCPGATDVQITEAFNRFLTGIPVERLQRLRELRAKGIGVYALSNTNPIMYNSWIAEHFRQEGLSINDYFDGIVASFQELCCKPDLRIFRTLLTRYGLKGDETLMLDDSAANCDGARHAGMIAIQVGKDSDNDMLALTRRFVE
ncbi:MAG: HAD family phosphatase [Muribaculaceae bacterium]|nr:HAD family phosphatase [Muribaculaceae bacterium]